MQKQHRCVECGRKFKSLDALRDHLHAKHPSEPSFASRLIDAQLEVAMGGYADDDLVDHLDLTETR